MNQSDSFSGYDGEQMIVRQAVDDRQALIGLLALISLALPALLIRYLFPNIDPLVLASLGVALSATYLGMLLLTVIRQTKEEAGLLPVAVEVDHD